jgi:hypothetical protein
MHPLPSWLACKKAIKLEVNLLLVGLCAAFKSVPNTPYLDCLPGALLFDSELDNLVNS